MRIVPIIITTVLSLGPVAHALSPQETPVAASESAKVGFRDELLDLGFDAASAIPVNPHERDRALVQEAVATTAVGTGLQLRAMAYAKSIDGWRRGVVYGELALDAAKSGRADAARTFARFAVDALGGAKDWQCDMVKVKVAQAMTWLGDESSAAELEKGVGEPEQGKVRSARVERGDGADFDEQIAAAERAVATKNFDLTRNALETCVLLAGKSSGREERWTRILALCEEASGKTTRDIQLRVFLQLAEVRHAQGSTERARGLVDRAIAIREGSRWMADFALPISADIARTLHRIGDDAAARAELERALGSFEAERARIADIFRAGALRPVAEAFARLGDESRARAVFTEAIEEASRNPNARPRAMDLAQNCASLARAGIEPDAAMWSRLRAIRSALVAPW